MHDLVTDFETVTPDLWIANEQSWIERLLKLPNWHQVSSSKLKCIFLDKSYHTFLTFV